SCDEVREAMERISSDTSGLREADGAQILPSSTALTACAMSERLEDLGMNPAAPRASARSTVSASALEETTTTGSCGYSPRRVRRPLKSAQSDIFRSSITAMAS